MASPLFRGHSALRGPAAPSRQIPHKVASVVAFLFTCSASATNGSMIPVDDGYPLFKNC